MSDTPAPATDPAPAAPVVSPTVSDLLNAGGGRLMRGDFGRWSYPGGTLSVAGPLVLAAIEAGTAFVAQTDHLGRPMAVTATPGPVVTFATAGTPAAATQEI